MRPRSLHLRRGSSTTSSAPTPEATRAQGIPAPIDKVTQGDSIGGGPGTERRCRGRRAGLPGHRRPQPQRRTGLGESGRARRAPGDARRAEEMYRRGAQCTPDPPEAWEYLARLLVRQGRTAQAEQLLRGRTQQGPDAYGARNALTWVLLEEKRLPEAEAEAKKILKVDEQNVRAMQLLAQCYFRQGKYELSRLVLENARTLDPTGSGDPQRAGHGASQAQAARRRRWSRSRPPPRSGPTSPRPTATTGRCWWRTATSTGR